MAGTVLGILAAALAVERWARLSRRVLRHYRSVAVFLGGHDSVEGGMTMEDVNTHWHCCSTRTRVEFVGKNRRSQVFSKKMIKNTTNHPPRIGSSPTADPRDPIGRSGAKKVTNERRHYGPRVALRTVWGCQRRLGSLRRNRSEIWPHCGDSGRLGHWRMLPNLKNGVS